jgi:soluble lytic murein transglycosylase-like protein
MRRLPARRHVRIAGAGLLLVGLATLAALQVPRGGTALRTDAFAALRQSVAASAATPAPRVWPSPTPATAVVPSPLPVLLVRVPLVPQTPPPATAPPAAAPAPAPPSYTTAEIESILTAAAQAYGVSPAWLIQTARCESNLNPYAYNSSGPYDGLLQFLPSTFRAHGGTDIWDPVQQAQIAAAMFAAGESSQWPVCSR